MGRFVLLSKLRHYPLIPMHMSKLLFVAFLLGISTLSTSMPLYAQPSDEPPPAPLCFDMNFDKEGVVRSQTGIYRYDVNCRLIVQDSKYILFTNPRTGVTYPITNLANIGQPEILDKGVVQAVDVYSPTGKTYFENGIIVCLKGSNRLIYAAQGNAPRRADEVPLYRVRVWKEFTCTTIFEPGLVVMVNIAVDLPPAPFDLQQCEVKTNYTLHLRLYADSKSPTLDYVPNNSKLNASAVAGDWYRVTYKDKTGWLNGRRNLLNIGDNCGRICEQNKEGTLLSCRFATDDELEKMELAKPN